MVDAEPLVRPALEPDQPSLVTSQWDVCSSFSSTDWITSTRASG